MQAENDALTLRLGKTVDEAAREGVKFTQRTKEIQQYFDELRGELERRIGEQEARNKDLQDSIDSKYIPEGMKLSATLSQLQHELKQLQSKYQHSGDEVLSCIY